MRFDGESAAYVVVCLQSTFQLLSCATAAAAPSSGQLQHPLPPAQRYIGSNALRNEMYMKLFIYCHTRFSKARRSEENPECLDLSITNAAARKCCNGVRALVL